MRMLVLNRPYSHTEISRFLQSRPPWFALKYNEKPHVDEKSVMNYISIRLNIHELRISGDVRAMLSQVIRREDIMLYRHSS